MNIYTVYTINPIMRSYFNLWKHITQAQSQAQSQSQAQAQAQSQAQSHAQEKAWTDARQEERNDDEFAANNDMEPEYWCWQCKYGDCDRH